MKISGPLEDAIFIERPNRFLVVAKVNGKCVESHLPDPGRLTELLIPGAALKVRWVPESQTNRKTKWTAVLVNKNGQWISIDSTLPNRFIKELLKQNKLPMFQGYQFVRSEVSVKGHRFDFLLEKDDHPFFLEVKSVTLVKNGVAMFPDAITERGVRHVTALADLVKSGVGAGVLFVCQRSDVKLFRPQWDRDHRFAEVLVMADRVGVKIWVISSKVSPESIEYNKQIPYDLSPF
ncbi:MAG: DNA/RNA nuclease SfsA [Candidatus Marinimicrobia bacterium]|nr:DNA/RNA nuclease SfsA [Candidatus Neomarinimicrobiota bacterium]